MYVCMCVCVCVCVYGGGGGGGGGLYAVEWPHSQARDREEKRFLLHVSGLATRLAVG